MKKTFLKVCLVAVPVLLNHTVTLAQMGVNIGLNGNQSINVAGQVDGKIKGSPYVYDQWVTGSVKLKDGSAYNDLPLMFDATLNRLIFRSAEGNAQTFAIPVEEFTLLLTGPTGENKRTFKKGFPNGDNGNADTFYEVLTDGNIKFLKKVTKQLTEDIAPGAITPSKQLKEVNKYYIVKDNVLIKVKKDKKSITNVLDDKKASEVETYISNNKLNMKDENDIVKLINYYNRLS